MVGIYDGNKRCHGLESNVQCPVNVNLEGCSLPVLWAVPLARPDGPVVLKVAVFGARLLARLSVVGAVAKFQEAAEELARMHALNASPDSPATQVCVSAIPSAQIPTGLINPACQLPS